MVPTPDSTVFRRPVRIAASAGAVAALPLILGLQLVLGHTGTGPRLDPAAESVVGGLVDQGLTCREKPALTDRVVFAWNDSRVEVVDFGTAVTAISHQQGAAVRYCLAGG